MRFSLYVLLASLAVTLSTVARGVEVYYAHTITSGDFSDAGSDLGNVGYWFAVFNRTGGLNTLPATDSQANGLPAYVTQTFGPTVDGSGGWTNYYDITLPNGTLGNSGALEINNAPTGPAGTRAEYMTLTFGAGAPSKLRLGVVTDNGDGLQWSNAQIIVNDESTGPLTNDRVPDVHFYDLINISPGDSVQIEGVTVGATVSHLGGVLLDTVTSLDLEVNTNTGQVTILTPDANLDIQGYTIASASGSLNPTGWTSLEGRAGFGNGNPADGVGWEKLGAGIDTKVGEFNLLDSTVFGPSGESGLSLGALFMPGGAEDLHVQITTADGGIISGMVHYVDTPGLAGDYNGDNVVDAADYLVWRNSVGQVGPNLPADGNGDNTVNGADYTFWKERYGNTPPGAVVAPVSVPEPAALLILGLVVPAALLARIRPSKAVWTLLLTTLTLPAYAERHADRVYRLGDDPLEGAMDNQPIGSGNEHGLTYDSEGMDGNGSLQDLTPVGPVGTLTYANTTAGPQAGVRGASFTGAGYLEHSNGLGHPGATPGPNPAEDYTGVTSRGMQAWVNPTDTGGLQYLIYDTEQFGIRINADDTWGMIWGAAAANSTAGRAYNSNVPVNFGQWSHVHQHSYGNTQGVLYVNGVAVASSLAGQIYQTAATPELDPRLIVGGDLSALDQNLYTGLIDEIELYVAGEGTSQDFGTFDLSEDNGYIASLGLTEGDLNNDDVVNDADVALFISNWRSEKILSGRRTGDLSTRNLGDFDYDGFVGLSDWYILANEHINGASLNLAALLEGHSTSVPEPATIGLFSLAGLMLIRRRRGRRFSRAVPLVVVLVVLVGSSRVASAAGYWNVDFQGDVFGTLFDQTAEIKNYGPDDFGQWNHLEVAGLRSDPQVDYATNPSWDLLDNDGNASSVNLSLVGNYAGWHGDGIRTDDLRGDYIILLKNAALGFPDPHLEMNLTGLIPGQIYSFSVITGTEGGGRHLLVSVDGAGDGNVANDPVVQANQAVTTHFRFTASPAGSALITMDPVNNEGNLAGIQLKLGERLPVLTINRATGEMVISNNTAESASVMGYMIESDAGSLLPAQWTSVTDNYDANSGNHSVDSVSNWMELTQPTERDNLSEVQEIGGTGATIVDGQVVNLGNAWVRSPYEDVSGEILLSDGTIVPIDVRYTGNESVIGDLDYNGVVNLDDWAALKTAFSTDSTSFSLAELYGAGDLNLDGRVNLRDMHTFAAAYDSMQGAGAFAAAVGNIAGVPEPATGLGLILLAGIAGIGIRSRKPA